MRSNSRKRGSRVARGSGFAVESLESRQLLTASPQQFISPSLAPMIGMAFQGINTAPATLSLMSSSLETQMFAGPVFDLKVGHVNYDEFVTEVNDLVSSYDQSVSEQLYPRFRFVDSVLRMQAQQFSEAVIAAFQPSAETETSLAVSGEGVAMGNVTLTAVLTETTSGQAIDGQPVHFGIYDPTNPDPEAEPIFVGTATTDIDGTASLTLEPGVSFPAEFPDGLPAGAYGIVAFFEGTDTLQFSQADGTLNVQTEGATNLTVAPAGATFGGTTNISATLTTAGGAALAGQEITFSILEDGTEVKTATGNTDASGVATTTVDLTGLGVGDYTVQANFAGQGDLQPSTGSNTLVISAAPATFTNFSVTQTGSNATFAATMLSNGVPVPNQFVQFAVLDPVTHDLIVNIGPVETDASGQALAEDLDIGTFLNLNPGTTYPVTVKTLLGGSYTGEGSTFFTVAKFPATLSDLAVVPGGLPGFVTMSALLKNSGGNPIEGQIVTFSIVDPADPDFPLTTGTIESDATGLAQLFDVEVTGLAPGTYEAIASVQDSDRFDVPDITTEFDLPLVV